jgi:aminomuconate-semialdehyde/2-hydroxymuconate-6-semialdehyde dehydrogenase
METILNFIGGEFTEPLSGAFLPNEDPSRGKAYSRVPDSGEKDVERAVAAAKAAFPAWAALSTEERAQYLRKLAAAIGENLESLALAESIDNGKPLSVARTVDIPRCRTNFAFFADAVSQFHGAAFPMDGKALNYTTYSPLGVVACISPWNLPLYLLTWKIAPALAMGNTVVAKPSEVTPMTAYLFSRLAKKAGLPDGVLNIVHGLGPSVGQPLVSHSDVKAVSFTGSTSTGRLIAEATAKTFKKTSLEMGGKNPTIVFADAGLEEAVEGTARAAFSNQGQICLCGSRILVERSIYPQFREALLERVRRFKQGDPRDPSTTQGALVSRAHFEKVLNCLAIAKEEGAKVLCGGERAQLSGEFSSGYFVQPTLLEGLSPDSRTNQEEIFGPVASIAPFDSEAEAVRLANGTRYGLSASVWTRDLARGHRVANALACGVVWINTWMLRDLRTPFGGVKESGVGREGGIEGFRFFSEVKNTCLALD